MGLPIGPRAGADARELNAGSFEPRAAEDFALRADRHVIGIGVARIQRYVHAFQTTVGRLFRAEKHAGVALSGAAEIRVKLEVLIAFVENEPAARSIRRSGDLAIRRFPLRVAE